MLIDDAGVSKNSRSASRQAVCVLGQLTMRVKLVQVQTIATDKLVLANQQTGSSCPRDQSKCERERVSVAWVSKSERMIVVRTLVVSLRVLELGNQR